MASEAAIVYTDAGGAHRVIVGDSIIVGRDPATCQIVLTDSKCSRRHCVIEACTEGTTVTDLASRNGTLLNGHRLRANEGALICHRDRLIIGQQVLVFDAPDQKGSGPPADLDQSNLTIFERPGDIHYAQEADPLLLSKEEAKSANIDELRRAAERLNLLVDVGQSVSRIDNPHELLKSFLEKLFEVFPQADSGVILLYGPDGSIPAALNPDGTVQQHGDTAIRREHLAVKFRDNRPREIKLSRTILQRMREKRESLLFSLNTQGTATDLLNPDSLLQMNIQSLICAPLWAGASDLGLVQLAAKSGTLAFSKEDLKVLTMLTGLVALLIRNTDLTLKSAREASARENLMRFLSPVLAERLMSGHLKAELGGAERKGTIFYSDIVGFTRMGGNMSPQNIVTLLNRYLKVMQSIIFRRGGSVDKCAGDQIMAFWGVLDERPDGALQAAAAGLEMQIAMFEFNRNERVKAEIALPPQALGHAVGVNTGIVCAGNIGSDQKIEFTVIGHTVNVAARIESVAGRYHVFVGPDTYNEIADRAFCFKVPPFPVKNVDAPLTLYSVRGLALPHEENGKTGPGQAAPPKLEDMLFCLPCLVRTPDGVATNAVATGFLGGEDGDTKIILQADAPVEIGSEVAIEWDVPEKSTLPTVNGVVERRSRFPQKTVAGAELGDPAHSRRNNAIIALTQVGHGASAKVLPPGALIVDIPKLPKAFLGWRPGLLLPSDLKTHSEVKRN